MNLCTIYLQLFSYFCRFNSCGECFDVAMGDVQRRFVDRSAETSRAGHVSGQGGLLDCQGAQASY